MKTDERTVSSVLLLDDSPDLSEHYKRGLEKTGRFLVTAATESLKARELARRQLFDFLVIDAKLDYRGFEFGGLRLADDLFSRYGRNSIIVMSRYITPSFANQAELGASFLEKSSSFGRDGFARALTTRIHELKARQYVFVVMPFDRRFDEVYRYIDLGVSAAGLICVRLDYIHHNRSIQKEIYESISYAKLIIFFANGLSANSYYEAGFAHALGKEVIIIASHENDLHFDVRDRNSIFYGSNLESISSSISARIDSLRMPPSFG